MTKVLSIIFTALLISSCHDGCKKYETKCAGDLVKECWSDNDWEVVEDCSDVGPGVWECCEEAFLLDSDWVTACVPENTCGEDSGI